MKNTNLKNMNEDEIKVDQFYLKSRGLWVFRVTYPDGSVVLWVSRDEVLDFLYAARLQKLQAGKKGR